MRGLSPRALALAATLSAVALGAGCGADPGAGGAPDPEAEQVAIVRAERTIAEAGPADPVGAPVFDRLVLQGRVAPLVDLPARAAASPGAGGAVQLGRQPRAWVASFVADGQWRLVFKAESGPCIVDCVGQRYWYFTVSPHGTPQAVGRYALVSGSTGVARTEGEPRWGFPGDEERRVVAAARAAAGR